MTEPFFLQPLDTLLLRSGHPNLGGEPTTTAALFPPTPWTWQGLVRTHLLATLHPRLIQGRGEPSAIAAVVGPPERLPPGWRLRGPFPSLSDGNSLEPWFPWPAFLSEAPKEGAPARSQSMEIPSTQRFCSNPQSLSLLGWSKGQSAGSGWISATNLCWALLGAGDWAAAGAAPTPKSRTAAESLPPFVSEERRPGLQIDRLTQQAKDGMLYTALHHRFTEEAGLWGSLDGAAGLNGALTRGSAAVGQKGRLASLAPGRLAPLLNTLLRGEHLDPNRLPAAELHLRVVLLTAAPVTESPLPFALPPGVALHGLQGAAGPDIGGYNLQGGASRPVRRTWAAGTSAWVSLPADHPDRPGALRQLAGNANLTEDERFGFGQRVIAPFEPTTGNPRTLEALRA